MIGLRFNSGRDLPLGGDVSARFLPWIIGFMVVLAALASAAAMVLSRTESGWRAELSGKLTVQIMPAAGRADSGGTIARMRTALDLLRASPGVVRAEAMSDDALTALLEPWLGPDIADAGLPMPRLIDVTLDSDVAVDTPALARRLARAVPGAVLDDHGVWLQRLLSLVGAIETVALSLLGLICLAAMVTVAFTTRAGLVIHDDIIEILHLVGAEHRYIARQFQAHTLGLALKGGIGGFLFAAAALVAVGFAVPAAETGLLPQMSLSMLQWLVLAVLPLAAAAIATVTAHVTVMRSLAAMS